MMKGYLSSIRFSAFLLPFVLFATEVTMDGPHKALRIEYKPSPPPETDTSPSIPTTFTITYFGLGDVTFSSSNHSGLVEAIFQYPDTNFQEGVEFAAVLFDDAQCILGKQMALTENARLPKDAASISTSMDNTVLPFRLTVMDADTPMPKVQILANVNEFDANDFYWDPPTTTSSADGKLEFCLQFQVIMKQASATYLINFVDVHITLRLDWN
jgi:hypothetical protein